MLRSREYKGGMGMARLRWSSIAFAAAYVALIVGIFFALGGAAYAQNAPSSAGDQYGSSASDQYGTKVSGVKVSKSNGQAASSAGAYALPNTGLSLAGTIVIGLMLVAGGVLLRRRER